MNRKHKAYIKINIISLFFIAISSVSVTLAWFAYSGLSRVTTEIDIKAWLIEFEKGDSTVSNNIVISLDDIYPGMETMHEVIKIKNKGDSNAKLSYSIESIRILDEELDIKDVDQEYLKDKLSHEYPFSINIDLSNNFIISKGEDVEFEMSVSWPLDSVNVKVGDEIVDSNKIDSEWGTLAYKFAESEARKYEDDSTYKVRPSIKIVISAKAEQLTENIASPDTRYPLGKMILYDVVNNVKCEDLGEEGCIRTHVIDVNNKLGDTVVTLLPDLLGTYESGTFSSYDTLLENTISGWNVEVRELLIDDILKIVSKDINNSFIVREEFSNEIIGYSNYENRITNMINETVPYNGYYSFLNSEYSYFYTSKCYWFKREYDSTRAFSLTKIDDERTKVFGNEKSANCSVVPVIIASKGILNK